MCYDKVKVANQKGKSKGCVEGSTSRGCVGGR